MRTAWRRIPRAAKACALVAFVNATVWAFLIPPYHVPDETVHVAYTQYLAETARLPAHTDGPQFSSEQQAELNGVNFDFVIGNRSDKPPWSYLQQERLERLTEGKRRDDGGHKTVATNQPPLYYGIQGVAYHALPGASLMTRLYAMRIVSALMAAATVLFVFLFLRELLPGTRWAWTVGALAVALQPMFAFEAGGVNNDNLFYLCAAALTFALARAFRRGLTVRRGAAIGAALGLGLVTKLTMVAFVPAVAFALVVYLWRAAPEQRLTALKAGVATVAVAAIPVVVYAVVSTAVYDRPLYQGDAVGGENRPPIHDPNRREQASYTWQLFLPRAPWMQDLFPTESPIYDTWFKGFNGRFGLLDYEFPPAVYPWMWWLVYLPLLVLAARGLWIKRDALRRRFGEFLAYAGLVVGLVLVVGQPSYTTYLTREPFPFYQPRYVLVLLPLFAAIVALAVRGAGRRFGVAAGTILVMLALAHTLFAQLLTITRYYA